jgi:DtxR family Mn-dependent transcriptional regulator
MLRFLAERGIRPGSTVVVAEREPFGGSVAIEVDGEPHAIGAELACRMLIAVG